MIDVFWCTCVNPEDNIRHHLAQATLARWSADSEVSLRRVCPQYTQAPNRKIFQGERRWYAEENAQSDIYVVADDDCMPIGKTFIARGLEQMAKHPEYVCLSGRIFGAYSECAQNEVLTEDRLTVGGVYFVRKGGLPLPPRDKFFDGSEMTHSARKMGLKLGIMRDVYFNHLGQGLSSVWPVPYTGKTQIY